MAQLYAPIGSPIPPPATDPVTLDSRAYDPAHAIPAVARRLLAVQQFCALTPLEMARAIEATEADVVDWLEGRSMPPLLLMNRLAKLVGFTLGWLYHGDETGLIPGIAVRLRAASEE